MDPTKAITENVRPCIVCHSLFEINTLIPLGVLSGELCKSIQADCASVCHPENHICRTDLAKYSPFVEEHCPDDACHIWSTATEIESVCTFKDRCADILSLCVGSWSFLIWSCVLLGIWIYINTAFPILGKFDPYPFILLNFVVSLISAIQAPVILMSQNRLAEIDRARATYDYGIDLKSELSLRKLHEKSDKILAMMNAHNSSPKTTRKKK